MRGAPWAWDIRKGLLEEVAFIYLQSCPGPVEVPGPEIKPVPQQWPELWQWQGQILNPLSHQGTPGVGILGRPWRITGLWTQTEPGKSLRPEQRGCAWDEGSSWCSRGEGHVDSKLWIPVELGSNSALTSLRVKALNPLSFTSTVKSAEGWLLPCPWWWEKSNESVPAQCFTELLVCSQRWARMAVAPCC